MTDEELQKAPGPGAHPDGARRGRRGVQRRAGRPEAHAGRARRHLPRQDHALERSQASPPPTPASEAARHRPSPSCTARTARAPPRSSPTTWPRSRPTGRAGVGAGKSVKWPVGLGGKGNEGVTGRSSRRPAPSATSSSPTRARTSCRWRRSRTPTATSSSRRIETTSAAAAGVEMPADFRVSITNAKGKDAYPIAVVHLHPRLQGAGATRAKGKAIGRVPVVGRSTTARSSPRPLDYAPLPSRWWPRSRPTLQDGSPSAGKSVIARN